MKYPAIMIDLETLGTRADDVIISIGAVKFNPDTGAISNDGLYASISIDSNIDAGRHISESTIQFWMKQPPAAQKVFFEPKITLASALDELVEYFDHADYEVWSNGADFDIPMLGHALGTHGLETPWKFWNTRCFRTIKNMPFAKRAEKIENPLKHNALFDAITQAKQLQAIYAIMKETV